VVAVLARLVLFVAAASAVGGCIDAPHADNGPRKGKSADPVPQVATAPANGFGDDIAWRGFDEGLAEAAKLARPMMLVVHASWCGQCKALKPKFSDPEIEQLSQQFVMVNVDQDQAPRALEFAPDGTYVPRVLFIDPQTGKADTTLVNEDRARTIYYYSPVDDLAGAMKKALDRHAG
jgi:protein-disulfide reductase (glutathione)